MSRSTRILALACTAALALFGLTSIASAFTVSPTTITATGRGQTFRSTTGISTACDQRFTINITTPTINLPITPGTQIGTVSNQSFTNCTSVGVSALGTWPLRLNSVTLSGGAVSSVLLIIPAGILAGGICLYSGNIGASIANGASTAQLLAGSFTGSGLCGTATTNAITYALSSAVIIR